MEDLLWNYPDKFFNETLAQFQRQPTSEVGRADIVFKDRLNRLLVVELKKGKLQRGAIDQLLDYFGMLKRQFPDTPVELMVVANTIPEERQLACDKHDIGCLEISDKKFRDVAAEVGYEFASEHSLPTEPATAVQVDSIGQTSRSRAPFKRKKAWGYWTEKGRNYFIAFVNAKGNCSLRTFDSDGDFLKREYGDGDYQVAFEGHYKNARPLTLTRQPNLEHCSRTGLPDWVLAEFRAQLPEPEAAPRPAERKAGAPS
jgi:hypothetical protein